MTIEQELKLRQKLSEHHTWPDVYMFKFILPNEASKLEKLLSYFTSSSDISQRASANGNFISLTVKEVMLSTESVIDRYKSIDTIEGLMSI